MNEIYSRGTNSDPDWIELYNPTSTVIDISGYKIYDSGGQSGSKPKKEFPEGTLIQANDFIVIVTDESSESGFGLSSSGEKVWLEDNLGIIIDTVTFPSLSASQSYGRITDGGLWNVLNTITRGSSNNTFTDVQEDNNLITAYRLNQNYPNPFNPTTTISFSIPTNAYVSLKIYDALGREVAELYKGELNAGTYSHQWNGESLASGIYFCRLQAGTYVDTKKLLLVK